MHDNFEDHDESIEYEIEVETDADVQAIPDEGLVLAREMLPPQLPIIPLRPRPAFPGVIIPLTVNGKERVETIKQAMETPSQADRLQSLLAAKRPAAAIAYRPHGVARGAHGYKNYYGLP